MTETVPMIETLINGRWSLLLPEHRAARPQWVTGWERERWDDIHTRVHAGDVIYDIGTEEGDLSALLAMWVGEAGRVVLFEPNPRVWPNIRAIFEANGLIGRVGAWWVGFAGDSTDTLDVDPAVIRSQGWPECAYGPLIGDHGFCNLWERPDIPRVRLDDLVYRWGYPPPDAITMDVEGSELRVLVGATRVLAEARPTVWVSVHPEFMVDMYAETADDLYSFMADCGYANHHLAVDHESHVRFDPQ